MKALSLRPEWAMPVALGQKTVECRTWKTDYRGPLLICASSKPLDGCIHGHALAVVNLDAIEKFNRGHLWDAMMDFDEMPRDAFAWMLSNAQMVEPFAVKGKLHLYEVDDSLVHVLGKPTRKLVERHYLPLVHRTRNSEADAIWAGVFADMGW